MKSLEKYVDAHLDFVSAESEFKDELCELLGIPSHHIKQIYYFTDNDDGTHIKQIVRIELMGVNRLRSEDITRIDGLTIITPQTLEIDCGDIAL